MSKILQAIWEPGFRVCSCRFRPHRNAHQALARLGDIITRENTQWVVEADIKSFFDHVNHGWLMRFLEHRIKDSVFLRIVKRFLKTGDVEEGVPAQNDGGTPQGGLVSSVLIMYILAHTWFQVSNSIEC